MNRIFLLLAIFLGKVVGTFGQGNQDLSQKYVKCTNCTYGSLNNSSTTTYLYEEDESNFLFSNIASDYGPRMNSYDFHGGVDFGTSGLRSHAAVCSEPGLIYKIKKSGTMIDLIINGNTYDYVFRHLFHGGGGESQIFPLISGGFVLLNSYGLGNLIILDLTNQKAYAKISGQIISYSGQSFVTTNIVGVGDWLGPIGSSGGSYAPHLHVEVLDNINYDIGDNNSSNPLEYLEYDTNSYYSNYYVQSENSSNIGGLKRGTDYYHAKFKVGVSGSVSGSSYSSCVLDIDEVGLEIGSSDLAFHYIKGKNRDAFLRYGGTSAGPTDSPSWITSSGQQGSPAKTGVNPEAYGSSHPFDYFYFKEFVPRVAKSGLDPNGNKIAEFANEAEYSDGKYQIRGVMETVKGSKFYSDLIDLEIDNFNPFLEKITLNNTSSTQEVEWQRLSGDNFLTKTNISLVLDTINFVSTDVVLEFSETVKVTTFKIGGISVDAIPIDGTLISGQFFAKKWTGPCVLPQYLPSDEAQIYVEAVDLQGAGLIKNPANSAHHIKSSISAAPQAMAFAQPSFANSVLGFDENHIIYYSGSGGGSVDSVSIQYISHYVKDGSGGGSGNSNHVAEPGESIDLNVDISNFGGVDAENVQTSLSLVFGPGVNLTDYLEPGSDISIGSTITINDFDFSIPSSYSDDHIDFKLNVVTNGELYEFYFTVFVEIPVPSEPHVVYWDQYIKDGSGGGSGNNNHVAEPGESIDLNVQLKNIGTENAPGVKGWLSSNSPFIDFSDTYEYWGTIPDGDTEWESDFDFNIEQNIPNGDVEFYLKIKSGPSIWLDTFSIFVSVPQTNVEIIYVDHEIKDGSGGGDGNDDEQIQPGEEIDLEVKLKNIGSTDANGVSATLVSNESGIDIDDSYEYWGDIDAGDTEWESDFDFDVSSNISPGSKNFTLLIESDEGAWVDNFMLEVLEQEDVNLIYWDHYIKDGSGGGSGNNNHVAEPGESIDINVQLKNIGSVDANSVSATFTCYMNGIDIDDSYEYWGDIDAGDTEWESDFDFDIDDDVQYSYVYFNLLIESDEGASTSWFNIPIGSSQAKISNSVDSVAVVFENLSKKESATDVYPNPSMDGNFKIKYSLVNDDYVSSRVYSQNGRLVKKLKVNEYLPAGEHTETISLELEGSGLYFLVLHRGKKTEVLKLIKN